jgi:hypothetical protein
MLHDLLLAVERTMLLLNSCRILLTLACPGKKQASDEGAARQLA